VPVSEQKSPLVAGVNAGSSDFLERCEQQSFVIDNSGSS
jgi:hypothetical protein